jgi:hypothetical protein
MACMAAVQTGLDVRGMYHQDAVCMIADAVCDSRCSVCPQFAA